MLTFWQQEIDSGWEDDDNNEDFFLNWKVVCVLNNEHN